MRYFKVEPETLNTIRAQVMNTLGMPHSHAEEPWPVNGTFHDLTQGYIALGPHHSSGEYAAMIEQAASTPGVEEIDEAAYFAAMPRPAAQ